jgi:SAM-dependent methyltransferase
MPASPTATAEQIKDANIRYHDAAATSYDSKWGIDFGPVGQDQVAGKLRKALGGRPTHPFADALEIGAGTGYFSLNLAQLGLIEHPTATDISEGMLVTLTETAAELGVPIATARAEAEELPFDDGSFDLVFGHAVLHHIPDLPRALAEFERVLRPGGTIAFCGEPSRYGDRLAALPKAGGGLLSGVWRRALGAGPAVADDPADGDGHELEPEVDVHAFAPRDLRRMFADAGYEAIRVNGEELIANAYGWLVRSLESSADPGEVPVAWRRFAFRSYLALQRLDTTVLEPRLPAELFYNLVLSARRPS